MVSVPGSISFCCHPKGYAPKGYAYVSTNTHNSSLRILATMDSLAAAGTKKAVWVWTKSKDVMTASVERGWNTFIFTPEMQSLSKEWTSIAKLRPLFLRDNKILDDASNQIALVGEVLRAEDQQVLESLSENTDIVVMDAREWQIISSENLVAFFQSSRASLFAIARSVPEARIYLESLERGTDGIVLQTEHPADILEMKAYLASRADDKVALVSAVVQKVDNMGMGDRVCVDLCSLLVPGEGLLVGSFARGLFLVHSECLKTDYVASRPFRINAGPVHAYVARPGGKTSYLAELQSGMQVLVVDANGWQQPATVGRVKIESRPLILVEAVVENDPSTTYSLLLQNAETVSLVQPPQGMGADSNLAIPVTEVKPGDKVLLSLQESARHTGTAIKEFIVEK